LAPSRPQVLFLLYHYFEAREAYNAIRIFIAGYVWMTGFGNFSYYYRWQQGATGGFEEYRVGEWARRPDGRGCHLHVNTQTTSIRRTRIPGYLRSGLVTSASGAFFR
jgi:hypothetical protein